MGFTQINIQAWDIETSQLPRWDLTYCDATHPYYASKMFLSLEWNTRDDGKWGQRSSLKRQVEIPIQPNQTASLIEKSLELPVEYPGECLGMDDVHTHGGYSPTLANTDSTVCRVISIYVHEGFRKQIYIRKDSSIWSETEWGIGVMSCLEAHLTPPPWKYKRQRRILP